MRPTACFALLPVLGCVPSTGLPIPIPDAGATSGAILPSFGDIYAKVFTPSCGFASCHGGDAPSGDLFLGGRTAADKERTYAQLVAVTSYYASRSCSPGGSSSSAAASSSSAGASAAASSSGSASSGGGTGLVRVVAGDPGRSFLVDKIVKSDGELLNVCHGKRMPLGNAELAPEAVAAIRQWITNGARND